MATIRKRGDSYQIRVSNGYTVDGKQVAYSTTWKPKPGMTQRQIEKELQRQAVLFEESVNGEYHGGHIKFAAFADQYFEEYAASKLKAKTIERYMGFKDRVYKEIGHLELSSITTRQMQKFVNTLKVTPCIIKKPKGETKQPKKPEKYLSAKTIKNYLSFVSSVFNYAIYQGVIDHNPCRNVTLPKIEQIDREIYTLEEAQQFLEYLEHEPTQWQAFFNLAIFGGLRRGELLGLEWKDIDFIHHMISINRSSEQTKELGIYTDTLKTKSSKRVLKMPETVMLVLKHYKAEQSEVRLKVGDLWENHDRLFTQWNGKPMSPNTPYLWMQRFCQRSGMRFVNIHSFRHLNATLLIQNGIDAKTVSASLGHSMVSTTLNIYAHIFAESQAMASEAIATTLANKIAK